MKIKFAILVFVVSVFFSESTSGQSDFVAITSSQLLKGLNDKAYLDTVLTDNGFSLIYQPKASRSNTKSGTSEYWHYKSAVFVDVLFYSGENYIIVRVHRDLTDFSERLVQTFPQRRDKEFNDQIEHIRLNNLTKQTAVTLTYSTQNENVGVDVWYEDPFYFFQYMKSR